MKYFLHGPHRIEIEELDSHPPRHFRWSALLAPHIVGPDLHVKQGVLSYSGPDFPTEAAALSNARTTLDILYT